MWWAEKVGEGGAVGGEAVEKEEAAVEEVESEETARQSPGTGKPLLFTLLLCTGPLAHTVSSAVGPSFQPWPRDR